MPSRYFKSWIKRQHLWELEYNDTGLTVILYPMYNSPKRQRWYIDQDDIYLSELSRGRIRIENKTTGMKWTLYTSDSHQFCTRSTAYAFDTISYVMLLS